MGLDCRFDSGGKHAGEGAVDPDQLRGSVRPSGHHVDDDPAPVAAGGHEMRVAEAVHQLDPRAPDAGPPCAVGSVSRSMILSCSITEPGQPWQTTSGRASSCLERTCTKWMS